ncbi:MAG: PIN domain-containing protein [Pyrinomonadaceae bacterium]
MNGNSILLDSDVIILASKREIDVERLLTTYDKLYVSVISYMEVYGFVFEDGEEKHLVDKLFTDIEIVYADKSIADIAIIYRKNSAKKIKLPDAVILATARYLETGFLTNNLSDFQGVDPVVTISGVEGLSRIEKG